MRCFLVVCEEKSFRKAAVRLNMSQSPLTRHIQSLEHNLNTKLLDRNTKMVTVTECGEVFRKYAQDAMRSIDEAIHLIQKKHTSREIELRSNGNELARAFE